MSSRSIGDHDGWIHGDRDLDNHQSSKSPASGAPSHPKTIKRGTREMPMRHSKEMVSARSEENVSLQAQTSTGTLETDIRIASILADGPAGEGLRSATEALSSTVDTLEMDFREQASLVAELQLSRRGG